MARLIEATAKQRNYKPPQVVGVVSEFGILHAGPDFRYKNISYTSVIKVLLTEDIAKNDKPRRL